MPAVTFICHARSGQNEVRPDRVRIADHSPEARERNFKRYTTVVSVSAGSGLGSPYISWFLQQVLKKKTAWSDKDRPELGEEFFNFYNRDSIRVAVAVPPKPLFDLLNGHQRLKTICSLEPAQFPKCLYFDLPDSLSRQVELRGDFL